MHLNSKPQLGHLIQLFNKTGWLIDAWSNHLCVYLKVYSITLWFNNLGHIVKAVAQLLYALIYPQKKKTRDETKVVSLILLRQNDSDQCGK